MSMTSSSVVVSLLAAAQISSLPEPPGRMVDVGGRRLHAICSGSGSPAVILEAGASSFAIDWTLVQHDVSSTTRVCSYDRAGMGWSDPAPEGAKTVRDLRTLLANSGERPPYVMVGASRGGLFVRAYHADHPDDVAGFVFVDPATEDRLFTLVDGRAVAIAQVTAEQIRADVPAAPVKVPRRSPQTGAPFDRLPPDLYRVRVALDEKLIASVPETVTPDMIAAGRESERALLARLHNLRTSTKHSLGGLPTVVLSRGDEVNADREAAHAALARLSTNSRHSVVRDSGHEIHLFRPQIVVEAIVDVVRAVRDKAPLRAR